MSVQEIETLLTRMPVAEARQVASWLEEYLADAWDRQIEADEKAGRLDDLTKRTDAEIDAGRHDPL